MFEVTRAAALPAARRVDNLTDGAALRVSVRAQRYVATEKTISVRTHQLDRDIHGADALCNVSAVARVSEGGFTGEPRKPRARRMTVMRQARRPF